MKNLKNIYALLVFICMIVLATGSEDSSDSSSGNDAPVYNQNDNSIVRKGKFYKTGNDPYIHVIYSDGRKSRLKMPDDGDYEGHLFTIDGVRYIVEDGWPRRYNGQSSVRSNNDYTHDDNDDESFEYDNDGTTSNSGSGNQHQSVQAVPCNQFITTREWEPCWVCNGTGQCKYCHGTGVGGHHFEQTNTTYVTDCGGCNGSGACDVCHGRRGEYREVVRPNPNY